MRALIDISQEVVLLTGATGFIGRHCAAALVSRGVRVHGVSRCGRDVPDVTVWTFDLFDPVQVARAIRSIRPNCLVHLAWEATPRKFWDSPENLGWVASSLLLVRAFVEMGGRRLIIAGTCAEYDWTTGDGIFRENESPLHPRNLYGVCKNALREVVEKYCVENGVSWAWARVFNPYGPEEPQGKLVRSVIESLLAGEAPRCTAGTQIRDYIYVTDLAEAFAMLLFSEVRGALNFGSGIGTSVAEIAGTLGEIFHRPDLIRLGSLPTRQMEPPMVVADVSRLTNEVGWQQRVGLRAGLAETVRHYMMQGCRLPAAI